jgi:hypothetical protein
MSWAEQLAPLRPPRSAGLALCGIRGAHRAQLTASILALSEAWHCAPNRLISVNYFF